MNDRTFENLDESKTTYHSDGSKSRTFDNLDGSKTTYHSDGSKGRTFENLDGSYTTVESTGEKKRTYKKIDGSYVTSDSDGNKAHTYENLDGSYTTHRSNSYNSVGGTYYSEPLGGITLAFAVIAFGICTILGFTCAGIAALPLAIVWIATGFACVKLKKSINSPVLIGWAELISSICYIILNAVYWNNAKGASMVFGLFGLYFFIPIGLGVIYVKLCETEKTDGNQMARYTVYTILNFYCVFIFALLKSSAPWMILIALAIMIGVNVGRTLKAKKKNILFIGESQSINEMFNKAGKLLEKAENAFSKEKVKANPIVKKAESGKNLVTSRIGEIKENKLSDTKPSFPTMKTKQAESSEITSENSAEDSSKSKIQYRVEELFYGGVCKICNKETDFYYEMTIIKDHREKKALICKNCCNTIKEKIDKVK